MYLEDKETGIIQDLRQNPVYTFNHCPLNDREFIVWFTEITGIDDFEANSNIMVYTAGNNLHIKFTDEFAQKQGFDAQIMVYDLSGKLVAQRQTRQVQNILTLPVSRSFYIVKVVAGEATVTNNVAAAIDLVRSGTSNTDWRIANEGNLKLFSSANIDASVT
ncbi:MAG: T9SS type A sorting domain-containing protein [Bacteroidales bacterium]|nr:T9SS type A sorting domain-containing protein [Bacteroidales bacterium]